MKASNTELIVRALENGTVIDHIPSNRLFKVVSLLHLDETTDQITIGNNLRSEKLGTKGVLKIADRYLQPEELNKLAILAPNAHINIIKDFQVVEKVRLSMPDDIVDVLQCVNPMCVTNKEHVTTRFHLIDAEKGLVKCHYCERVINREDCIIK